MVACGCQATSLVGFAGMLTVAVAVTVAAATPEGAQTGRRSASETTAADMPVVFNLGLPKSGTTSLHEFTTQAYNALFGYDVSPIRSCHWVYDKRTHRKVVHHTHRALDVHMICTACPPAGSSDTPRCLFATLVCHAGARMAKQSANLAMQSAPARFAGQL